MSYELPVIWTLHDATYTGRLEVRDARFTLTSRNRTFSFGGDSVAAFAIERAPTQRLRGLPALSLRLLGGDLVRVASMGGAGSLHELAAVVGSCQPAGSGT